MVFCYLHCKLNCFNTHNMHICDMTYLSWQLLNLLDQILCNSSDDFIANSGYCLLKKYIFWFVFRTALQMLVTLEHNSVQPTMMSNTRGIFMSGSLCIMIPLHRAL